MDLVQGAKMDFMMGSNDRHIVLSAHVHIRLQIFFYKRYRRHWESETLILISADF